MSISKIINGFIHGLLLAIGNYVLMTFCFGMLLKSLNMLELELFFKGMFFIFSCLCFLIGLGYEIEEEGDVHE